MHRILIVEDHLELQQAIPKILGESCSFEIASTLKEGFEHVNRHDFDLILLDVDLPDGDGFKLCANLKQMEGKSDIPVIFLTGDSDIQDKVMAFSLGADDYILKPFDARELRARVFARLERSAKTKEKSNTLVKGDLSFALLSQRATVSSGRGAIELPLTPLEFKLLLYFARHEDHVLTREQLISAVWNDNVHVLDRTIDSHISNLRRHLGPSACEIKSVYGEGYRFTAVKKAAKARQSA
ncbi:MAG: response regulator transcription factor [Deltaproteobacteria bacterium]|nr:response regulator transcription factor [Deltaproteobacteria bacterium]